MDLKTYVAELPAEQRELFAVNSGTTIGHLRNVMYGFKTCATDLAVAIEANSGRQVTRRELRPLDWWLHWPELVTAQFPIPGKRQPRKAAA